eukprot:scaffold5037_cov114-Isochrysis_galbana.AAC.12
MAVKGTIKRSDRTFTLYDGVAVLKLCRCRGLCNGTGGVDIRIEEPGVEAHGATMDNGRGGGKAIDVKGQKPLGAHA